MKLHLGCGTTMLDGWVNCDLYPSAQTDCVFDLTAPWPFADSSVVNVYASHVLEHLADFRTFFAEMWRVLSEPSGVLLRVPYGGHRAAWWDVEHMRPWFSEAFCFLQPGYAESIGNPQHTAWAYPFGIHAVQLRIAGRYAKPLRWKIGRKVLAPHLESIPNAVEELFVHLYVLKSQKAQEQYRARQQPNVVPQAFVMYKHHWELRDLAKDEAPVLHTFADGSGVNGFGGR